MKINVTRGLGYEPIGRMPVATGMPVWCAMAGTGFLSIATYNQVLSASDVNLVNLSNTTQEYPDRLYIPDEIASGYGFPTGSGCELYGHKAVIPFATVPSGNLFVVELTSGPIQTTYRTNTTFP